MKLKEYLSEAKSNNDTFQESLKSVKSIMKLLDTTVTRIEKLQKKDIEDKVYSDMMSQLSGDMKDIESLIKGKWGL